MLSSNPYHQSREVLMNKDVIDTSFFESEIRSLEQKVLHRMFEQDIVAFYGSSSIRMWETMETDLIPLNVMNLGFGGATISWCAYYFDRLVSKLHPVRLVLYVGDNDLAMGISPDKVLKKYERLLKAVRFTFPQLRVDLISIKPSPNRMPLLPEIVQTNTLLQEKLVDGVRVGWVNVFEPMQRCALEELYLEDGLHLNEKGYALWRQVVRTHFGL